jgi:hypothetical protein
MLVFPPMSCQQTIARILTHTNSAMMALRNGHWKGSPPPPLGHDPQGKVLGILGMGGIGRNLMKKASAFGMTCQYHNRTKLSEELSGGAKYVSFDELLATSDVLSLNLPLNVCFQSPSPTPPDLTNQPYPEKHPSHNLDGRIQENEKGRRNRQHRPRRRNERRRPCPRPRVRSSMVLWSRRIRRRAQGPRRLDEEPACDVGAAYGHMDRGDADQDGNLVY